MSRTTPTEPAGIRRISVSGFKSIRDEQTIEIRPLTILAGVNSSGKSSMLQPVLLLKQTLEAPYDPGPLRLDGPNVIYTDPSQLLSRLGKSRSAKQFNVSIEYRVDSSVEFTFRISRGTASGLEIDNVRYRHPLGSGALTPASSHEEIVNWLGSELAVYDDHITSHPDARWSVMRDRCFLRPVLRQEAAHPRELTRPVLLSEQLVSQSVRRLIHVSGLRGNVARTYPATAAPAELFTGRFHDYAASIIGQWQRNGGTDKLESLAADLQSLGLCSTIHTSMPSSVEIEVMVGRLPGTVNAQDLVNIADVGLGVGTALPMLVALTVADAGWQPVYIEQPEIHLHPRAQVALAEVLARAAKRGVRVIAETHSSLLLLGIQGLVAEGKLDPSLVKLHWFSRSSDGKTTVNSADLDEAGRFGDWPEDFGDVGLKAESRYLDAVEARLAKG